MKEQILENGAFSIVVYGDDIDFNKAKSFILQEFDFKGMDGESFAGMVLDRAKNAFEPRKASNFQSYAGKRYLSERFMKKCAESKIPVRVFTSDISVSPNDFASFSKEVANFRLDYEISDLIDNVNDGYVSSALVTLKFNEYPNE